MYTDNVNTTGTWNPYIDQNYYYPQYKPIKRITRTIEKYDAEGKYTGKEIITEEIEDDIKVIYPSYPYTYVSTSISYSVN